MLRTHSPERQREAGTGVFGCAWTWALCGPRFYLANEKAGGLLSSSGWGRLCAVASAEPFLGGWVGRGASAPGRRLDWCKPWASFQPSFQALLPGPSGDLGEPICSAAWAAAPHTSPPPRKPVPARGGAWDAGLGTALVGGARGEHDLAACAGTGRRKPLVNSCFVLCVF